MKYIPILLLGFSAMAAEPLGLNAVGEQQYFQAKELNVEAFGAIQAQNLTDNPDWGAGVGVSYFITRGFGFGVRAVSYETRHSAIDQVEPRLIVRAPLWDRIAPYGYAAGTYSFEHGRWGAGAGGGLEYRFSPRIGVFAEAGLHLETGTDVRVSKRRTESLGRGSAVGAAGIRFSF